MLSCVKQRHEKLMFLTSYSFKISIFFGGQSVTQGEMTLGIKARYNYFDQVFLSII